MVFRHVPIGGFAEIMTSDLSDGFTKPLGGREGKAEINCSSFLLCR